MWIVLVEIVQICVIMEYYGCLVGNGVIVLQEGVDDCVISGLIVYNNYGIVVENMIIYQMVIFGCVICIIIINSNVWVDGNDVFFLWVFGSNGMYYYVDFYFCCLGVDFFCFCGWCYVICCYFYGDSCVMIWYDG